MKRTLFYAGLATILTIPLTQADEAARTPQKPKASIFRENPHQDKPALELKRLRNEGVALYESGIALDDALRAFERAYAQGEQAVDAFNCALVYFRKNDSKNAKAWLDKALARDPELANAHYLSGVLALTRGDHAAAKQSFQKALTSAPTDGYLHYQLALLARMERDEPAFLQHLVNALGLEPDNTAALYQMYRYYQTSGNRELADQTLERFNALKKLEKFSRKEKQKDPSRLAKPIGAAVAGADGFELIAAEPVFQIREATPGCRALAADRYVASGSEPVREYLAVACANGQLLRLDPNAAEDFTPLGKVPENLRDMRLEWFDEAGPRVIALTDSGVSVAQGLAGETGEYATLAAGAGAPLMLADLDADGDMDIAFGGDLVPLTNANQLKFIQEESLYRPGPVPKRLNGARAALAADLQRDGLADLAVLREDALVLLTGSPAGFREALSLPMAAGADSLVLADFSNDGRPDLALNMPGKLRLLWNPDPSAKADTVEAQDLTLENSEGGWLAVTDYNNDGLVDLLRVAADGRATLFRNDGARRFSALPVGQWPAPAVGSRPLGIDFGANGLQDLAYVTASGGLALANNATEGTGKSIALFAHGARATPSGRLTQIEVRRGGHYGYAQSAGSVVRLGIGRSDYVEVLRLEWSNGFVENKLNIAAAAQPYYFKESERISGSCPSLFVWNGKRFDYLTDTFISGPMGVPLERGVYFPVRDRELVLIPGDRIKLRNGHLDLRFTEELHESVFLDRARLLVVDHPAGTAVYPHSRLAPVPVPADSFYTTGDLVSARRATGSDGSDLTTALASIDKQDARFFRRSRNSGYAEPHWIELTLPESVDPAAVDAVLATGWFFYFESTSMIAQSQHSGASLPWPWLEQWLDGAWRDVGPVGIPTGKGKTAVMPVKGKLKSRRLRLRSGISLYWDRIAFSLGSTETLDMREARLTEAGLRFHGFSDLISRDPEIFDYHTINYSTLWSPMIGSFTAYGPVESLLGAADGRYAVFGSGDEIAMSFDVGNKPPSAGTSRSYLLELVGYVKDGDRYTASPGRVEPMPYLGMNQYPAPKDQRLIDAQTRSPLRTRAPLNFTLAIIGGRKDSDR